METETMGNETVSVCADEDSSDLMVKLFLEAGIMPEDDSVCPQCDVHYNKSSHRRIVENCGHSTCRKCCAISGEGCTQCAAVSLQLTLENFYKEHKDTPIVHAPPQPPPEEAVQVVPKVEFVKPSPPPPPAPPLRRAVKRKEPPASASVKKSVAPPNLLALLGGRPCPPAVKIFDHIRVIGDASPSFQCTFCNKHFTSHNHIKYHEFCSKY